MNVDCRECSSQTISVNFNYKQNSNENCIIKNMKQDRISSAI